MKSLISSILRLVLRPMIWFVAWAQTHIEEGCIIAMGATVSGRIPKGSVVGSPKVRTLKMRDMEKYERLKAEGKFH
jgi:carbonic anhydrase/acetyltransferase-like protein (isoleucine patch superfamily)